MQLLRATLSVYLVLLACVIASAQNVTSPYSTLGIGDIDNKRTGRYFINGAAISRRNSNTYNDANPASLTSLGMKLIHFDVTGGGRAASFQANQSDTLSAISKDLVIRNVSLSFRPHFRTAFAFGLKPFSTVNYKYQLPDAVYNTTINGYSRSVEGSGGINQVFGSFAYALSKKLSAGLTASYLFGGIHKNTGYYDEALYLDINKDEYRFYSGGSLSGGLQYYSNADKTWQHTIGLTGSIGTALKGYAKTDYTSNDTTFLSKSNGTVAFKLPASAGLGYTASNQQGLSMSVEGNYYYWPKQTLSYVNSYTSPSVRLAAGWEYAGTGKYFNNYTYEKYYIGMGLVAQNSYFHLNGRKIWDYMVQFGGGYNISGNLYIHAGMGLGYRGSYTVGQIKERYSQFTVGMTVRSMWYKFIGNDDD